MPSNIKIEIRAQLSRNQKIYKTLPYKHANSLLKQFIQICMVQFSQLNQTITDVTNTARDTSINNQNLAMNAGNNVTTFGIVIGTGTDAVTMTDYKLQTKVTTNIYHAIVTFATENPDANTWRAAITRIFTNNTGTTLQIREVGLYAYLYAGLPYPTCVDRTLYSVDVPNGISVTLTYRITVSL
jgi:hypothetical protein